MGSASEGCAYSPGEHHVGRLEGPEEGAFDNVGTANGGMDDWYPVEARGIQWLLVSAVGTWREGHDWDEGPNDGWR